MREIQCRMIHFSPKHFYAFSAFCFIGLLIGGCNGDEPTDNTGMQNNTPVTFASEVAGEGVVTTRGPSAPLAQDFRLCGYKLADAQHSQLVFNEYLLTYVGGLTGTSIENTDGYSYIDAAQNQTIKYWDYSQTNYRFWGYVPVIGTTTYDKDHHTLTFGHGDSGLDADALAACFCARTKTVESIAFGNVVVMEFVHPAAQVEVRFYSAEQLEKDDRIELTEISFKPESEGQLVAKGRLRVEYDPLRRQERYLPSAVADGTLAAINYAALALDKDHCTSATSAAASPAGTTAESVNLFPHGSDAVAVPFTMSVCIDGDVKTAAVPASYMHWLPNYHYTYIFKIAEAGKDIEFYDVLVAPWLYGGGQDEEWKNW